MIGIIFVLSIGAFEKFSMYFLHKTKERQHLSITLNYLILSIVFFLISFFYYKKLDFNFLHEIYFYITILLENLILYLMLKNYNKQNNFTQIAFASFSSIYLIIFLNYIYSKLNIKMVISSPYNNMVESFLFSFLYFILTLIYFYDKINKKEIKHPFLLFIFSIILVNTLYFSIYIYQHYQGFTAYSIIFTTIAITNIFIYIKNNNIKTFKKNILLKDEKKENKLKIIKNQFSYTFFHLIAFVFAVISGSLLSPEFFAVFKRTGSIFAAYTIDKFLFKKENIFLLKDKIILFIIFFLNLYLFFR